MWKYFVVPFLGLFLISSSSHAEELVDRIVAVVNDDVITLSELNQEGDIFFQRIHERLSPAERPAALQQARQQVLAGLIDKKITEQKAAQMGVMVREEEIDAAIQTILQENNATVEKFQQDLAAMGITEKQYRSTLKGQMLLSRLIGLEVRAKIVITDDKIKEHYNKHYLNDNRKAGYSLLQMGFSWDKPQPEGAPADTKEAARKKAVDIRNLVLAGQSFRELARKFSDLPSAVDGGDIGIFAENEMAAYMKEAILALQPGEVSQVIETASGFQFFKLLSVEQGGAAPFEKVKEEIRDKLYQQQMELLHDKWVKEMREQAYIVKML